MNCKRPPTNGEIALKMLKILVKLWQDLLMLIFKTKARGFIFTLGLSYGLACYLSNMQIIEIVKNLKILFNFI
jgi:hypothetical protein